MITVGELVNLTQNSYNVILTKGRKEVNYGEIEESNGLWDATVSSFYGYYNDLTGFITLDIYVDYIENEKVLKEYEEEIEEEIKWIQGELPEGNSARALEHTFE